MMKFFKQEIEKRAVVGSVIVGALTAQAIKDDFKQNKAKYGIKSGTPASGSSGLSSPYKHQFGGSNVMRRTGKSPHSLYS